MRNLAIVAKLAALVEHLLAIAKLVAVSIAIAMKLAAVVSLIISGPPVLPPKRIVTVVTPHIQGLRTVVHPSTILLWTPGGPPDRLSGSQRKIANPTRNLLFHPPMEAYMSLNIRIPGTE